ncbi:MAG: hypothetical protein HZB70_03410 [Candidatus Berkelbacteria bacterium]|nr:MAG: hypothetical protein HZB70_03410 [Candidatus Berkelbacteria bacterium]QQG51650.1 MAG: hypothetical protein HY845_03780 [Candidatus Berkelbacteria bacterium]
MFFVPLLTILGGRELICYVDCDVKKLRDNLSADVAVEMVAEFAEGWSFHSTAGEQEFVPDDTDFMIGFLWTDEVDFYVDLWIQRQLATYGECGPMTTLQTFRFNGEMVDPWEKGNACAWTRIVSGLEALHFHQVVRVHGGDVKHYINGPRPELPESFIVPWPDPS